MRRGAIFVALTGTALTCAALGFAAWVASLPPLPKLEAIHYSTEVLDREGRLLRPYATEEGRWRLRTRIDDVDPRYLDMLIAYEDRRFRKHHGVDPLALLRAGWLWLRHREIVSGGSTITMQVARLIEPRTERNILAKLRQMVRAIELERAHSKDEILALYLSLAPYGGNLEGIRSASLAYFGKEPKRLTRSEAALLVALPQSPEARRPDRSPDRATARPRSRARSHRRRYRYSARRGRERQDRFHADRSAMPMPALAPHASRSGVAVGAAGGTARTHHRCALAARARNSGARARRHFRCGGVDCDCRGRSRERRGPGARGVVRLFRSEPGRAGGPDAGAAFAGLRAQAVHLRASASRTASCIPTR